MKKTVAWILVICLLLPVFSLAAEDLKPVISSSKVYTLKGSNAVFCPEERGSLVRAVEPGSAVIFPIENASRAEDLKNLKLFTVRWEMGEEFTSRPYIEYRMLYDETGTKEQGYSYVAVLPVLFLAGEQKANVRGSITLGVHSTGNYKRKFSFVIRDDGSNPYSDSYLCDGKDFFINFDSSVHQASLMFDDKAQFSVDAFNQGPVNVGYTLDPFSDIMYSYPDHNLQYLRFIHNPVFDRIGELILYYPKGSYIYEVTPSRLEKLEIPYNEEKGGFTLKTRRLGDYVISEKPLPKKPEKVSIYNPPTGFHMG